MNPELLTRIYDVNDWKSWCAEHHRICNTAHPDGRHREGVATEIWLLLAAPTAATKPKPIRHSKRRKVAI